MKQIHSFHNHQTLSNSSPDTGIRVLLTGFGDKTIPHSGNVPADNRLDLCGKFKIMKRVHLYGFVITALILQSCDKDEVTPTNGGKVFTANGNINATVDQFRLALGDLNNTIGAVGGR